MCCLNKGPMQLCPTYLWRKREKSWYLIFYMFMDGRPGMPMLQVTWSFHSPFLWSITIDWQEGARWKGAGVNSATDRVDSSHPWPVTRLKLNLLHHSNHPRQFLVVETCKGWNMPSESYVDCLIVHWSLYASLGSAFVCIRLCSRCLFDKGWQGDSFVEMDGVLSCKPWKSPLHL